MTESRRKLARQRIDSARTSAYGAVMSAGDREVFDLLEEAVGSIDRGIDAGGPHVAHSAAADRRGGAARCVCLGCTMRRELER